MTPRDGVPEVFFDGGKLRDHPLDGGAIHAGDCRCHQLLTEVAEPLEQRAGGRRR